MNGWQLDELEIRERRVQRLREMQKKKHRQMMFRKYYKMVIALVAVCIVFGSVIVIGGKYFYQSAYEKQEDDQAQIAALGNQVAKETPSNQKEQIAQGTESDTILPQKDKNETNKISAQEEIQGADGKSAEEVQEAAGSLTQEDTEMPEGNLPKENLQVIDAAQMPEEKIPVPTQEPPIVYEAEITAKTQAVGDEVVSSHALLIDLESGNILAQKDAKAIISPASMTKVLTLLVAAERLTQAELDDTFTMTLEITDYSFVNDCSNAGFLENEVITVRDMLYGTILPSGADAAVGLATYVAGSHEAFVTLMNQKLEELGLSETAHFTNCVGLYDEEHYCTIYDMAMIMNAAIENELCREIMSTRTYTTSATEQHPDGITISNWFLRRIEDKDTGGEVICGKTGYVTESGSCAVSFGIDHAGKEYICATADSTSSWRCIYDHVALYKEFAKGVTDTAT